MASTQTGESRSFIAKCVLFGGVLGGGLRSGALCHTVSHTVPATLVALVPPRVGRTARYTATGRALLLLLPSEKEAMLQQLQEAKVPLKQLKHNPSKVQPISPALSALLSKNAELKSFAQSGLVAYVRSVYLQPNKAVFDAAALPLDEYAESLGLLAAPRLKFLKRVGKKVVQEVVVGSGEAAAAAADGVCVRCLRSH